MKLLIKISWFSLKKNAFENVACNMLTILCSLMGWNNVVLFFTIASAKDILDLFQLIQQQRGN